MNIICSNSDVINDVWASQQNQPPTIKSIVNQINHQINHQSPNQPNQPPNQ